MSTYQYLLFFLATVVLTLGAYYFILVFFVHRKLDKHFYFALTTLGASLYMVAQFALSQVVDTDAILLWHRLKLLGMLVIIPSWLYCIYAIFRWPLLVPHVFLGLTVALAALLPTALFVAAPTTRLAYDVLGLPVVYQFGTTHVAYTAFALTFIAFFLHTVFRVLRPGLPRRDRIFGSLVTVPPLLAGLNDFAITHRLAESLMLAEFSFFAFLITAFFRFVQEQYRVLEDLKEARRVLIDQARAKKELEIAAHIQTSILPVIPPIADYDVSVCMIPAEEAGGDYYDYERTGDGRHWFCVGDVSGHGLTPGLVMLMAQSAFRTALSLDPHGSPAKIVGHVNKTLYGNIHDRLRAGFYMTCAVYTAEDGGIFRFAGAHLETLVYRCRDKRLEHLPVEGMWLGIQEDIGAETRVRSFRLDPGDALVLYTDGITEARNAAHEQYGMHRFEEQILVHGDRIADELRLHLLEDVYGFMHQQTDDITLYVVKRL